MNLLLRKSGVLAVLLAIAVYAVVALRGPNGITALREKRSAVQKLQDTNASLSADNERKRERIERLKHSRAEQEMEIRKRLHLMRQGEKQVMLPNAPDAAPAEKH